MKTNENYSFCFQNTITCWMNAYLYINEATFLNIKFNYNLCVLFSKLC